MKFAGKAIWVLIFWSAFALIGCANHPVDPSANGVKTDIVTDSDEPENRKRARIRLELASGYFEQGQTNVALDELKQALLADPNFVDAHNLRGLVYMRLNNLPLAESSFRRALTLNPNDADVAHNFGWLLCQQSRYKESFQLFEKAIGNPNYGGQAKSLMAQGICEIRDGKRTEAEQSLTRAYQLDAGNPLIAYNLSHLLYERGELTRAQFYVRRLNNSELANAETLWLGIKIERSLNNGEAVSQLGDQLKKRFGQSREAIAYDKGAFNE